MGFLAINFIVWLKVSTDVFLVFALCLVASYHKDSLSKSPNNEA